MAAKKTRKSRASKSARDLPAKALSSKKARDVKAGWSGPGDEGPEESITFVYGGLGVQYTPQTPNGAIARKPR